MKLLMVLFVVLMVAATLAAQQSQPQSRLEPLRSFEYFSGQQFVRSFGKRERTYWTAGFVAGVSIPDGTREHLMRCNSTRNVEQLTEIVLQWVTAHPDIWYYGLGTLSHNALVWSCGPIDQ